MKTLFAILSCILSASLAQAEGVKTYSRTDCLKLSLERSAAARNAVIDEAIAHARMSQARGIALPHLTAGATYTRLDELQEVDFGDEILEMGTLDNYSLDLGVNQLLFAGGKVNAALNAAGLTRKYAAYMRAEVESSVAMETTKLFNMILLAEETVAVLDESVSLLGKLVNQTQELADAGKAAEFDVLTAQVRYENEIPQLMQASNTLAVLKESMKRWTGLDDSGFAVDGELAYAPLHNKGDALVADALAQRALLRSYEAASALRKEDVSSARSDLFPSVGAFFTYNGANSYRFVSFGEEAWEWHWNAGVALKWNLWDGDITRGVLKEKKLAYAKSVVDLDDNERAVVLEVKRALLAIEHAEKSVLVAKKGVSLAERAMEIAATRHESGLSTYLDYTDANVALKRARLQYLTSVSSHMNAVADLKHAVGTDLGGDLEKKKSGESDE